MIILGVHKYEMRKENKKYTSWLVRQTAVDFSKKIRHITQNADDGYFNSLGGFIFARMESLINLFFKKLAKVNEKPISSNILGVNWTINLVRLV